MGNFPAAQQQSSEIPTTCQSAGRLPQAVKILQERSLSLQIEYKKKTKVTGQSSHSFFFSVFLSKTGVKETSFLLNKQPLGLWSHMTGEKSNHRSDCN